MNEYQEGVNYNEFGNTGNKTFLRCLTGFNPAGFCPIIICKDHPVEIIKADRQFVFHIGPENPTVNDIDAMIQIVAKDHANALAPSFVANVVRYTSKEFVFFSMFIAFSGTPGVNRPGVFYTFGPLVRDKDWIKRVNSLVKLEQALGTFARMYGQRITGVDLDEREDPVPVTLKSVRNVIASGDAGIMVRKNGEEHDESAALDPRS